jgi:hypothetical protein
MAILPTVGYEALIVLGLGILMRGGIGFRKRRKWNTQVESGMRNDEVVEVGEKGGST